MSVLAWRGNPAALTKQRASTEKRFRRKRLKASVKPGDPSKPRAIGRPPAISSQRLCPVRSPSPPVAPSFAPVHALLVPAASLPQRLSSTRPFSESDRSPVACRVIASPASKKHYSRLARSHQSSTDPQQAHPSKGEPAPVELGFWPVRRGGRPESGVRRQREIRLSLACSPRVATVCERPVLV